MVMNPKKKNYITIKIESRNCNIRRFKEGIFIRWVDEEVIKMCP